MLRQRNTAQVSRYLRSRTDFYARKIANQTRTGATSFPSSYKRLAQWGELRPYVHLIPNQRTFLVDQLTRSRVSPCYRLSSSFCTWKRNWISLVMVYATPCSDALRADLGSLEIPLFWTFSLLAIRVPGLSGCSLLGFVSSSGLKSCLLRRSLSTTTRIRFGRCAHMYASLKNDCDICKCTCLMTSSILS